MSAFTQEMKPEETEVWDPEPAIITPGMNGTAPSDAIILFDGKSLDGWVDKDGGPAKWKLEDGAMIAQKGAGDVMTRQHFGSAQIHIEWRTPAKSKVKVREEATVAFFYKASMSFRCSTATITAPTAMVRLAQFINKQCHWSMHRGDLVSGKPMILSITLLHSIVVMNTRLTPISPYFIMVS